MARSSWLGAALRLLQLVALLELVGVLVLAGLVLGLGSGGFPFVIPEEPRWIAFRVYLVCLAAVAGRDLLVLAGTIAGGKRRGYAVAVTGAVVSVLPVPLFGSVFVANLGPPPWQDDTTLALLVFGLANTAVWSGVGVAALVALMQPEARAEFRTPDRDAAAAARNRLDVPTALLCGVGWLNLIWTVFCGVVFVIFAVGLPRPMSRGELVVGLIGFGLQSAFAAGLIVVVNTTRNAGGWGLAVLSAIGALLPCTMCAVWTVPVGIWLLCELTRPETRRALR